MGVGENCNWIHGALARNKIAVFLSLPILITSDLPHATCLSVQERNEFEAYDAKHNIRKSFIAALQQKFPDYGLTYSIGGQISFDIFPKGWDKTYALQHVEAEGWTDIHFFGDKTYPGGNDYEIYEDPRTVGHSVENPDDTMRQLRELFQL